MRQRLEAVLGRNVPRETFDRIAAYVAMLQEETRRQNLISASSLENIWDRHILDSAQLVRFAPREGATWADIGSGAGLPGIVLACIIDGPVTLIEPRRLRAEFLHRVCDSLQLNASVAMERVERTRGTYEVITARAVTALPRILEISQHLSTKNTIWILPKGRSAQAELVQALDSWQGVFHVEQSVTDPESKIVVASGVGARK